MIHEAEEARPTGRSYPSCTSSLREGPSGALRRTMRLHSPLKWNFGQGRNCVSGLSSCKANVIPGGLAAAHDHVDYEDNFIGLRRLKQLIGLDVDARDERIVG
jgi:hypothetical protein